jgi:small subunit ribosomal protein S16
MLKIRLSMGGAKKRPVYKIVVADSRFPRDGRFIEKLGSFNPLLPKEKKERIKIESERVKHWLSKGARPTVRVSRILGEVNIMPMPKPGNNPQKAIPKKDRKKEGKEEPKKEAPKQEAKKEEPKKEAPKQEAKKEEPKKEAPKQEAKKEEPKKEAPKQEAKKEEPKKEEKK